MQSTSRQFPGFTHIYELSDAFLTRPLRATAELVLGEPFALTRGERRPKEPLAFVHRMGGKVPSDVIWTGYVVIHIFADRVVELLRQKGFTGWSTYPVEVRGKDGEVFPGYHGMSFPGRCGPIENARSTIVYEQMPGGVFPRHKGIFFAPETWDGSDFFMPSDGSGFVFVTEAVKEAFEKAKVKNVCFSRLDEIKRILLE